jgi:hypothetical protein
MKRKFGTKYYLPFMSVRGKEYAREEAEKQRKRGKLIRITKQAPPNVTDRKTGNYYSLWIRD